MIITADLWVDKDYSEIEVIVDKLRWAGDMQSAEVKLFARSKNTFYTIKLKV